MPQWLLLFHSFLLFFCSEDSDSQVEGTGGLSSGARWSQHSQRWSYNYTCYIDRQTVLRFHTSAHQVELLGKGHTDFLVTGDVYRRDSIDSIHYLVFHQMEGVHVFFPGDWEASGMDGMSYAAEDLKKCLEGLARHLFGDVEMHWIDTYFPFTNPSFELEIYFQFSKGQLGVKFKPFSKIVQVQLIDNFTNKKGMTSQCYQIAYRSMECSLADEEINELQWNVRGQVQSKLKVVLR